MKNRLGLYWKSMYDEVRSKYLKLLVENEKLKKEIKFLKHKIEELERL